VGGSGKIFLMLVFIDDSGDPGFNLEKGASVYFVIACVVFDDELEAEKTAVAIKEMRRRLDFPDTMEFKFNKSRHDVRVKFLKCLSPFSFRVRAIVVCKTSIKSPELKNSKDSFYNYFIKQVLKHNRGTLKNAKVRIDGHGDRMFRRNLTTYLRRELNQREKVVMKNLRLVDSRSNVLIQMADMIAGALRRSYDKRRKTDLIYKELIKANIEDCWIFK